MAVDPDSRYVFWVGSFHWNRISIWVEEFPGLRRLGSLGEEEEKILSLREKSSGSASGVGRGTTAYCCLRGEEGDCRGEANGTGFGFGFDIAACCILSDLSLGRVELNTQN